MKAIPSVVFAALALVAGAALAPLAPGWVADARADEPAAAASAPANSNPPPMPMISMAGTESPTAAAEGVTGLDGWQNVKLEIDGVPPKSIDAYAAIQLARKNGCMRCHAIDHVKTGPSFQSVAQAYKGKIQAAEQREYSHLTAGDIFVLNGNVDHHRVLKTSPPNDPAQLKNLVFWILSLDGGS